MISFISTAFFAISSINEVSFIRRCTPLSLVRQGGRTTRGKSVRWSYAHIEHTNHSSFSVKRRYMLEYPRMERYSMNYFTRSYSSVIIRLLRTISRKLSISPCLYEYHEKTYLRRIEEEALCSRAGSS